MKIFINDRPFDVMDYYRAHGFTELPPTPTMSAADIQARSGTPSDYALFKDDPGAEFEEVANLKQHIPAYGAYPACEAIPLKDGMRFVTVPPHGFGA